MFTIILEEADKAIIDSYNEGYKQAVLEYKPKLLQAENNITLLKQSLQKKEEMEIKNCITSFSVGLTLGFITGGICGFNIAIKLPNSTLN